MKSLGSSSNNDVLLLNALGKASKIGTVIGRQQFALWRPSVRQLWPQTESGIA
jgi:hypothetical protein